MNKFDLVCYKRTGGVLSFRPWCTTRAKFVEGSGTHFTSRYAAKRTMRGLPELSVPVGFQGPAIREIMFSKEGWVPVDTIFIP